MLFPPRPRINSRVGNLGVKPFGVSLPKGGSLSKWMLGGLLLAVLPMTQCTLNDAPSTRTYFRLEATPLLTTYSNVTILFGDTLGKVQDTLFDDSLSSLALLYRLPVSGYTGGKALISIQGYKNGALAYSESRLYDGRTQKVLSLEVHQPDSTNPPSIPPAVPTPIVVSAYQKPSLSLVPRDTNVSIKDSVLLTTEAFDPDGDLFAYAWKCTGASVFEDSAAIQGYRQKIPYGKRFREPGNNTCTLRIYDKGGRKCESSVAIHVELDPPKADAGKDTSVLAGTQINLHGMGSDGYGPIYAVAWKIGDAPFTPVLQWDKHVVAPNVPGEFLCILRVMDTDSLYASDTLVVTVTAK